MSQVRKKRRTALRRVGCGGLGLAIAAFTALLLALVAWLNSPDFQRRAQALLVREIERATGESFSVEQAEIRLFPPQAALHGATLSHRATGAPILTAIEIRAPVVWSGGRIKLGRLQIVRPQLELHVDRDGKLREFRNLPPRPPPDQRKPLTELPWRSIEVVDANLRLHVPDGFASVESLNVLPGAGGLTDVHGVLHLQWKDYEEATPLDLTGVTLGPERIDIPSLHLQLEPLLLDASWAMDLGGTWSGTAVAHADLEKVNVFLEEPRAVHGSADLDVTLSGTPAEPVVEATLLGRQLGLEVAGILVPVLSYEIGDLSVSATATKQGIAIDQVISWFGAGRLLGSGFIDENLGLQATITGERLSLEHVLKSFDAAPTPWIDMYTDLEVELKGPLKPLNLLGDFEIAVRDLNVGDRPISAPDVGLLLDIPHAHAAGTMVIDKDKVYLAAPRVRGPRSKGSLTASIGTKPRGPLDLQFTLHEAVLEDFRPLGTANLAGSGVFEGRIWGPFNKLRAEGFGDIRDFSCIRIPWADRLVSKIVSPDMKSLHFDDAVAEVGDSRYEGDFSINFVSPMSMETDITLTRGRVEDIVGIFIDLPGLTGELDGWMRFSGPVYHLDGEGHLRIADADLWGEKFGTGEAHGYIDDGLFTLDDTRVSRHEGTEGLILRGSIKRDWALNMELVGDGFRLERLDRLESWKLPITGRARFLARIDHTLFDPAPHGRIVVDEVRFAQRPVEDSVLLFETKGGVMNYSGSLLGGSVTTDGTLGLWGEQPYALELQFDRFPAHLGYPTAADGKAISALVSGSMDVSGDFGEVWSPVALTADVEDVDVRWDRHRIRNTAPFRYTQNGKSYALTGFGVQGERTALTLELTGDGTALTASGSGTVDLDLVRAAVPGMTRSDGTAAVQLTVSGAAPNLHAVVDVELDGALMRHSSVPAAFEDVKAKARVTSAGIELTYAEAGLGGGMIHGSGTVRSENWVPKRWDLDAQVVDAQIQWVDYLPPAVGDAQLSFDGPVEALLMGGEVQINDMVFADRIDWEDWVVAFRNEILVEPVVTDEEPLFNLDVHMTAPGTVRLRNNVAEGTASADLRLIGDTVRPGLIGWARVDEGDAFLQDRRFRIQRGNLAFNDPWSWDPDLDFSLVTDVASRERTYRITLGVVGPFSNWRTTTRSDPPLPEADVNALLWFGVTLEDLEDSGELLSAVVQGIGDLVLTDLFLSTQASEFGDEVRTLFFDKMEIATGLNARGEYSPDPRIKLEKRYPELGDTTMTAELNLVRPGDQYYRIDKQLSQMWTLSGWYATLARDRGLLPVGGAFGVDVSAEWEAE